MCHLKYMMGLGVSVSLNLTWNLGSMLGMVMTFQTLSGLLLLLNYNSVNSYDSIMYLMYESNYGWLIKMFHSNNASMLFLILYLHLMKGLKMHSYRLVGVWYSGLLMMILIMATAFSGYVLVGSQMSYWAAMVITSLISVIPFCGTDLMILIWGGYSISWVTLQTLLMVHFILPFLVFGVVIIHLSLLHKSGSTSSLYSFSGLEKVEFMPYYITKDMLNVSFYLLFIFFMLIFPYSMGEVELFEEAHPLSSPAHIVPEMYFLMFYAILRSVSNKSLGVFIMFMSLMILFIYPLSSSIFTPLSISGGFTSHLFFVISLYLSYLGFSPISQPFTFLSIMITSMYFLYNLMVGASNCINSIMMNSGGNSSELQNAALDCYLTLVIDLVIYILGALLLFVSSIVLTILGIYLFIQELFNHYSSK